MEYRYAGPLTSADAAALTCNGTSGSSISTASVTGGSVAASSTRTLSAAGIYEFWAIYSGDSNNNGSTSTCRSEIVNVVPNSPSGSTAQNLLPNDSGTITGATADAGGTLTFALFSPSDATCSGRRLPCRRPST